MHKFRIVKHQFGCDKRARQQECVVCCTMGAITVETASWYMGGVGLNVSLSSPLSLFLVSVSSAYKGDQRQKERTGCSHVRGFALSRWWMQGHSGSQHQYFLDVQELRWIIKRCSGKRKKKHVVVWLHELKDTDLPWALLNRAGRCVKPGKKIGPTRNRKWTTGVLHKLNISASLRQRKLIVTFLNELLAYYYH